MAKFNAGQSFSNGDTVTGPTLNNITGLLDIYTGLISEQTAMSATVSTADQLLIADTDNGDSGAANRVTVQKLLNDTLTNGTYTNAQLSGNLNVTQLSTLGTISSTTGTIQTLTSSTANISQGSAIFTKGTIATLNSTTGTIGTLVATGTITGSTNVVNIGSGQIYKDATGNVGIGVTSPISSIHAKQATPVSKITLEDLSTNRVGQIGGGSDGSGGFLSFLIGNNGGSIAEAMRIDSSGNVGIGTTSPLVSAGFTSLTLNGTTSGILEIKSNGTQKGVFFNDGSLTRLRSSGTLAFDANNTEAIRIDSSGGVTIAGLAGSGSRAVNASAAGLLSAASDASLKEEVVGAHIAGLDEILQIHPKMYRWKDDIANRGDEASVELGFIANDVAPIIPSAAPMGNDGLYGFYDRSITAALVKAVQELSAKVTALEAA
ncbi:MAG: tail fiber domain-containing protein [Microbacteriaceae bacterium]|nr:tail fiber domain-containing protein [Microbacteriaceae bacterium]